MKNRIRFILKSLVAAAFLAAVTAAFFGAPTQIACRVQPAATWIFLAVLLLTPLAGRLFCETMCPLGILQSVVNRLFHPRSAVRRVCTRLPESRANRIFRWTVLAVFAVLLATGLGAAAWCLTPYSIYGKALVLFAPGVALLAAVLTTAAFGKGRFWCNWICPAGTLFTLLSRRSVLSHKVGPGCSKCRACFPRKPEETSPAQGETMTRRETIKGIALLAAVETAEKTTDGGFADISLPGVPDRAAPALPPGAVARVDFNLKCVGCGLCIKACRGECLSASLSLRTFGQPQMDFRRGFCLTGCRSVCGSVCPTGAISPIKGVDRLHVHVGTAVFRRDLCIRTTDKIECTACSRKCPVNAIKIVDGYPEVDAAVCIGCGACEHVCPSRPEPAVRVEGFADRQRVSRD